MTGLCRIAPAALTMLVLGGCAAPPGTPNDPLEGFNRSMFSFNEAVDKAVLKPVATGYEKVVPQFVRARIDNFFANLGDAWSAVNLVLQAKPQPALETGMRFVFNSTLGLGGLFDIAGEAGMERRNEDFGQTLGWWGVGPGPYLVLPILGPSTVRDSAALAADFQAAPTAWFQERRDQVGVTVLQVVSTRARLLSATRMIDDIALDKYLLIRDGFLVRRRNQVYDGNPPEEPEPPEEGSEAPPPK
ncbi:MAG: VacJ family lipoprotein [Burkholderiaceae bacterium]|nr:VacJ family lipoprotein [Burkholderiaceae bacterium]